MLKLRIIFTSAIILLLVGLDLNVRATLDSKKADAKSTEKDDSEKKSKENGPQEIITHLDFFGAFSLVNVQLQWRDLNSVLNNESKVAKSSADRNTRSLQDAKKLSLDGKSKMGASSPVLTASNDVIPARAFRAIDGKTHFIYTQNKQIRSTIAYIQQCSIIPDEA